VAVAVVQVHQVTALAVQAAVQQVTAAHRAQLTQVAVAQVDITTRKRQVVQAL
jgi:hypothetical protein